MQEATDAFGLPQTTTASNQRRRAEDQRRCQSEAERSEAVHEVPTPNPSQEGRREASSKLSAANMTSS